MKKWQYRFIQVEQGKSGEKVAEHLSQAGQDGWRVVSQDILSGFLMEREIIDPAMRMPQHDPDAD